MTDKPVFYNDLSMNTYDIENGYEHIDMDRSLTIITKNIKNNGHGIEAELDIFYPDDKPLKRQEILKLQDNKAKQSLTFDLAGKTEEPLPFFQTIASLLHLGNSHSPNSHNRREHSSLWSKKETSKGFLSLERKRDFNSLNTLLIPPDKHGSDPGNGKTDI